MDEVVHQPFREDRRGLLDTRISIDHRDIVAALCTEESRGTIGVQHCDSLSIGRKDAFGKGWRFALNTTKLLPCGKVVKANFAAPDVRVSPAFLQPAPDH